jgi:uncharacterized protein YutE (UPF0331/DUF86 family)
MDEERIKTRLLRIGEYKKRLKEVVPDSYQLYSKSEFILKNAIERNLQLISDMQFDVLLLVYKGLESRLEGDEDSLLESLKGKLGSKVVDRIKERRLLRNLLVHTYKDNTYDETAFKQAKNTEDLDEFVKVVKKIIEK